VGILARIRENPPNLMYSARHLDSQHERRRRLRKRGLPRCVELAVRNAGGFLAIRTSLVTAVVVVWVAFQMHVKHGPPLRHVLVLPIGGHDTVPMEMSERSEG